MRPEWKNILLNQNDNIRSAIKAIDSSTEYGLAVVVDKDRRFAGVLTNGDVTRAMLSGASLDDAVEKYVNREAVVLKESELNDKKAVNKAIGKLLKRKGDFIPVLDERGEVKDLANYLDLGGETPAEKKLKRTVLVIGGAGYLGSVMVKKLLDSGYDVICLDAFVHGNYSVCDFTKQYPGLKIIKADIRNLSNIVRSLAGVQAVIHLAAVVGDPACLSSPTDAIEINYLATRMIAEAAKYSQINRFIYASTCSVYGVSDKIVNEDSPLNPVSLYARSKIKSEEGILEMVDQNFAPTIMRMSTLFGISYRMRFDLVVNTLVMKAVTEGRISIFGGNQWRPLLHTQDAADAYLAALDAPIEKIRGKIYNVGSEKMNYRIFELGDFVKKRFPEITLNRETDAPDARSYQVSFKRIRDDLAFNPKKSIDDAITEIAEFISKEKIDPKDQMYSNGELVYNNGVNTEDYVIK